MSVVARGIASYLPMDRRHALAEGRPLPSRSVGTALFADLSGFTPLTDRLATRLGPRRAGEELTRLLERVYGPMIDAVHDHRGSVIGFAGDAITCWFDGDDGARALSAAQVMQREIGALGSPAEGVPSLAIKVAVTSGTVQRCLVGDPDIQQVEVLLGDPIEALGVADEALDRGEIRATRGVLEAAGSRVDAQTGDVRTAEGLELVRVHRCTPLAPDPWPDGAGVSPEQARPWLHLPVYERLRRSPAAFLSELRNAAALFCGFAVRPGPERVARLDGFVRWVQRVVQRRGGTVVQITTGDKGMYLYAAFGAPVAHERVVERAARAALELARPPRALGLSGQPRLGLSWGRMRTGAYGSPAQRTYGVLGDEVNVAARLMGAAGPGQVLCGPGLAAVAGEIVLTPLGERGLKGRRPTLVYALEECPRSEGGASEAGRLVARDAELELLRATAVDLVEGWEPSAVLVLGDAGLGKTSVLRAAARGTAELRLRAVETRGDPLEQTTSLYPWRHVLEQLLGGGLAGLEAALEPAVAAVLVPALGIGGAQAEEAVGVDRQARVLSAATAAVDALRGGDPLLMVVDDAHFLDPASRALLARVGRLPAVGVIAAARVVDDALIEALGDPELRRLEPLQPDEVRALLAARLGTPQLPDEMTAFIHRRAEGNPFFTEEIAAALVDSGAVRVAGGGCVVVRSLDDTRFPDTIEGLVTARLDRFAPADQLTVKVASVLGRVFRMSSLREVFPSEGEAPDLDAIVHRLQQSGLLSRDPMQDGALVFRSVVLQEVAYGLMLLEQRRSLHDAVADALEGRCAEDPGSWVGAIAWHRVRALDGLDAPAPERRARAVQALLRSGAASLRAGASVQAEGQLQQAVRQLSVLPPGRLRDTLELPVRSALGAAQVATRGPAAPEARESLQRARTLAETLGDTDTRFQVSCGLWYGALTASDPSAVAAARALVREADEAGDVRWQIQAHQALGASAFLAGRYEEGLAGLDRALALIDRAPARGGMLARLRDPRVTAHCYRAFALWFLGRPQDADAALRDAERWAGSDSHPLTRCAHQALAAVLHRLQGRIDRTEAAAGAAMELAQREHSPFWLMTAEAAAAWVLLARGDLEAAHERLVVSRERHRASGVVPLTTLPVETDLAEVLSRLGRHDEAEAALVTARALADSRLSFGWGAEVHGVAAHVALRQGRLGQARDAAEAAVAAARDVGSPALVARALATRHGVPDGARPRLVDLERWVRQTLEARLPAALHYHCAGHTLDDVVPAARRLADRLGIDGRDRDVLLAAALLHDVGFVERSEGHEAVSARIARAQLPRFGFSEPEIERVCAAIGATQLPQSPADRVGEILADADLDVLGRADFWDKNAALRRELSETGRAEFTDRRWRDSQVRFLAEHRYFTPVARRIRDAGKAGNLARLRERHVTQPTLDSTR